MLSGYVYLVYSRCGNGAFFMAHMNNTKLGAFQLYMPVNEMPEEGGYSLPLLGISFTGMYSLVPHSLENKFFLTFHVKLRD